MDEPATDKHEDRPTIPRSEPEGQPNLDDRPPTPPRGRRALEALGAFGIYLVASIAVWGLPVLRHLDRDCVGVCSSDTKLYVWAMAWMQHAVTHGLDPLFSTAVWAPQGTNLTWVTTLPGPSFVMAPITGALGPLVSENLLMLLAPALGAWAAYLLCRQATDRFWPALFGGAVFGFSTYMVQHMRAQLNLLLIFFMPLAAYLVVRRVRGSLGKIAFVLLLAAVLVGQFSDSSEMFASLAFFGGIAYAGALAFGGAWRRRLLRALPLVAAAYAIALVAVSPFLIKAFTDLPPEAVRPLDLNSADLLSFLVPRATMLFGGAHFANVSRHFPGLSSDDTAYLGPAFLLILVLFAWDRRRERSTWLLLGFAAIPAVLALGPILHVHGVPKFSMPGKILAQVPLLQHALPERFPAYVWLVLAVASSLWLASGTGRLGLLRYALVAVALVGLAPDLNAAPYHGTLTVPPFITEGTYQQQLAPGSTILVIPRQLGDDGVWQAYAGFWFNLGRAYVGPLHPTDVVVLGPLLSDPQTIPPTGSRFGEFIVAHEVKAIVIAEPVPSAMSDAVSHVLGVDPVSVGGVEIYHVPPGFDGTPAEPIG